MLKHVASIQILPDYFNYELGYESTFSARHRVKPAQTLAAGASGDGLRQILRSH
jgi:hypothetical protein